MRTEDPMKPWWTVALLAGLALYLPAGMLGDDAPDVLTFAGLVVAGVIMGLGWLVTRNARRAWKRDL